MAAPSAPTNCASAGTKLDLVKVNPNVCFEAEANVEIIPGDQACGWSVHYQSVVGFGHASVVEDSDEKRAGINALLIQYSDDAIDVPQSISPDATILRVDVHSLTGKESTAQ